MWNLSFILSSFHHTMCFQQPDFFTLGSSVPIPCFYPKSGFEKISVERLRQVEETNRYKSADSNYMMVKND